MSANYPPTDRRRQIQAPGSAGGQRRVATLTLELLVAFSLLTTVLAVSVPLVVRHSRILMTERHYRLALEELTNQIERLTATSLDQLPAELQRLKPSSFAAERLAGVQLNGQLEPADVGQRLTLSITWDEPQRREAPLKLAAWILPENSGPATSSEEANEP
jgi:hypothetical protein